MHVTKQKQNTNHKQTKRQILLHLRCCLVKNKKEKYENPSASWNKHYHNQRKVWKSIVIRETNTIMIKQKYEILVLRGTNTISYHKQRKVKKIIALHGTNTISHNKTGELLKQKNLWNLFISDIQTSFDHISSFISVCPFVRCCVEGKICQKCAYCFVYSLNSVHLNLLFVLICFLER